MIVTMSIVLIDNVTRRSQYEYKIAIKAIVALVLSLPITLSLTLGRAVAFPLTHTSEEISEAWNGLKQC